MRDTELYARILGVERTILVADVPRALTGQ
jgi:hypothetical protein